MDESKVKRTRMPSVKERSCDYLIAYQARGRRASRPTLSPQWWPWKTFAFEIKRRTMQRVTRGARYQRKGGSFMGEEGVEWRAQPPFDAL